MVDLGSGQRSILMTVGTAVAGTAQAATENEMWDAACDWVREMECEQILQRSRLTCMWRIVGRNPKEERIGWRRIRRKDFWKRKRKDNEHPLAGAGVV